MANPIIKIKRGEDKPPVWNGTSGITSGEFAYDKVNNVLYIGITGGYCGAAEAILDQVLIPDSDMNVIPVGMQISNDNTFGGPGANDGDYLGYASNTVPTTKAVKDYVTTVKANTSAGFTFYAGPGITFEIADPTDPRQGLTFINSGVLKGFTAFLLSGNSVGRNYIEAISAKDALEFVGGSGILLAGEIDISGQKKEINIINVGVTGINGRTGDIKSYDVITSLSGSTAGIGLAVQANLVPLYPIEAAPTTPTGNFVVGHAEEGTAAIGTFGGIISNIYNVPQIIVNKFGHVTAATSIPVDFASILPNGFTEAVEDIAYVGITSAGFNPSYAGISFQYVDNGNGRGTLFGLNTGVRSLGIEGGTLGLSGAVKLQTGNNGIALSMASSNRILISNSAPYYRTITATKATDYNENGGIYDGGYTGPGDFQLVNADSYQETLRMYAGRGIGISAGQFDLQDGIMIWNSGLNTLTALDDNGFIVGTGGLSGNAELQAGANITLARNGNKIIINPSGGSSTGAVSYLKADYARDQDLSDNNAQYDGTVGVTGAIEFIGRDGLITRQTIEPQSDGNPGTRDGQLFVGLSSKVYLPAKQFQSLAAGDAPHVDPDDATGYAVLGLPRTRETRGNLDLPKDNYELPGTQFNYLKTDSIEGGLTGAMNYPAPSIFNADFSANPNVDENLSVPGKILILVSREGQLVRPNGTTIAATGRPQAEVRLLGWPNPENMGGYIDNTWTGVENAGPVGQCPDPGCVGFPPVLPSCAVQNDVGGFDAVPAYITDATSNKPTIVANGNFVAKDSMYVAEDIWLVGNILDAKTGCLYTNPGGVGNGFNGYLVGNLTVTGDVSGSPSPQGNIYVHGSEAYFNVNNFAIEDNLIKIGGVSGGAPLNGTTETLGHRESDRGIIFYTNMATPPLSVNDGFDSTNVTNKKTFVGIDRDQGVFRLISDATIATDGNDIETVSGTPLSIIAGDLNNVGVTGNPITGRIYLKGRNVANQPVTSLNAYGHLQITASNNSGAQSVFTLGTSSQLDMGANSIVKTASGTVEFLHGVTFGVGGSPTTVGSDTGSASNNLQFTWRQTGSPGQRVVNLRNLGDSSKTQLVDVGRYTTSTSPSGVDLSALGSNAVQNAPQQVLWNKTLSDGTIIDCGTY